jgi:hypothetical protein
MRNARHVTKTGKTPFESMWGRKPTLQHLRKWGCMAYVRPPRTGQSTLGAQAIQGMFVGYELKFKAYRVRVGRRIFVSYDVQFLEPQSGAKAAGVARSQITNLDINFGSIPGDIPYVELGSGRDEIIRDEGVIESEGESSETLEEESGEFGAGGDGEEA